MKAIVIGAHLRRDDVEPDARAMAVGDLFLSALDVADDQPLGDRELLLRVAAVRARLLQRATFIGIRYGFSVTTPEQAHSKVAPQLANWRVLLEQNRGNVEMTLKVAASHIVPRPDRAGFSSGAGYLRALHAATRAAALDPEFQAEVERRIVPLTTRHRWVHRDEKSMELVALVERGRVDEVLRAGEALRATGAAFLLSGPWPLEAFADDHE